jgi:hypothetical protein
VRGFVVRRVFDGGVNLLFALAVSPKQVLLF